MTERIKTLEEIEAELLRDVPPPLETTTTTSSNYIDDGDELMQPRVVCRSAFTERAPTKRRDGDKHTTVLTLDELDEFSSESAYAPVMTADLVVDECGELMARSLVLEARTPEKFDGFMCKMERRAIELRASLSDNDAVRHGETMETSALDAYKRIMGAYDKPAPTTRTPAKVDSFMREMEKRAIELRALADDEAAQRGETMEASVFDAYKRITSAYDKPASAAAM